MKTKNDPRHVSRVIALQKLFEHEFHSNTPFNIQELQNLDEDRGSIFMQIDEEFSLLIVKGVINDESKIDEIIGHYTKKRSLEDTATIDLLVLRIAIFELIFCSHPKTPTKVIIDEAIELAKEFGGEKSFTFVNGVLGSLSGDIENGKFRNP